MMPAGKKAPSRAGKTQVICYVEPDMLDAVKARAQRAGNTLQQALAMAINAEAARLGMQTALTCERHRMFVRVQRAAAARVNVGNRVSRAGRKSIAGWFDRNEVRELLTAIETNGTSAQKFSEQALRAFVLLSSEPVSAPMEAIPEPVSA